MRERQYEGDYSIVRDGREFMRDDDERMRIREKARERERERGEKRERMNGA